MNPNDAQESDRSDRLLIEKTLAGDSRAYSFLVLKYQGRIQRLIGRMVRDAGAVEDIAQDSFIRAYRALHQFRGEAQFYTWLYRIAVNTAKKHLLALRRDAQSHAEVSPSEEDAGTSWQKNEPSHTDTPESLLAAREIAEVVNQAMNALPEELRQALMLREIDGLSYEEIASVMLCPPGTVRSRIFRAREAVSARVRPLLEKQTGKRW